MNAENSKANVEFDCDLSGLGWINFSIQIGAEKFSPRASWMERTSFDDLLQAVIELHEGATGSRAQMCEEPDAYRWIFTRKNEQIHLCILLCEGMWSIVPDEEGTTKFDAKCSLQDFSKAFVNALERLLEKWGIDGFKEKWRVSEFPIEKYETLRRYNGL